MTSVLTETRPVRMDPDLLAFVEGLLQRYKGEEHAAAKAAVEELLHKKGVQGTFTELCDRYRDAAIAAVEELR